MNQLWVVKLEDLCETVGKHSKLKTNGKCTHVIVHEYQTIQVQAVQDLIKHFNLCYKITTLFMLKMKSIARFKYVF